MTIMAGNVVTGEMVQELILSGADIIKVRFKVFYRADIIKVRVQGFLNSRYYQGWGSRFSPEKDQGSVSLLSSEKKIITWLKFIVISRADY